jgi:hypothetical protein
MHACYELRFSAVPIRFSLCFGRTEAEKIGIRPHRSFDTSLVFLTFFVSGTRTAYNTDSTAAF